MSEMPYGRVRLVATITEKWKTLCRRGRARSATSFSVRSSTWASGTRCPATSTSGSSRRLVFRRGRTFGSAGNLRLGWADTKQVRVVKPTERAALLLGPLEDGSRGPGDQDPAVGDHLLPGREPAACRVRSASARPRRPHHARGRHHCRVPARAGPGQARERRSDDPPSRGRRRVEATRLLGVLKHAQSMLRLVDPKATQSFLGKLIKRAGRAVGTIRK